MAAPTAKDIYESCMNAIKAFYDAGGTTSMKVNGWEITTANIKNIEEACEKWRLTAVRRGELPNNIHDGPVNVSRFVQMQNHGYLQ
jgi:hypothetical protein